MNCDEIRELLEDYVVGDLDAATQHQVEAHLTGCVECAAIAAAYAEALAMLPDALAAASPHALPAHLRDRILSRLSAPAPQPAAQTPVNNSGLASGPLLPPRVTVPNRQVRRLRLALIAAIFLLVLLAAWSVRLTTVLAREGALRAEFSGLVDRQEIVLEVIDSPHTVRRVLRPPASVDSTAYGKVFTRDDMVHVVAMAARLPVARSGQAYHLWLEQPDGVTWAGTLNTNVEGFGLIIYDADRIDPPITAAYVTLQAGHDTPALPPVLIWRAAP